MPEKPSILMPALFGGIITGVLSGIPFLNFINCLCCAGVLLGGFGVGGALLIAPIYIAEIAPPDRRGRLVSFNQLNIVIGISAAFFSNYVILSLAGSGAAWVEALGLARWNWRWMLGVETLPAILYFIALYLVPESPRWLAMRGRDDAARRVLSRAIGAQQAEIELQSVKASVAAGPGDQATIAELLLPSMRRVVTIGILVAVLGLALFTSRFFCRVLCPIGAIMAPMNFVSFWFVRPAESNCLLCSKCDKKCPVEGKPSERISAGRTANRALDCVVCHQCQTDCPARRLDAKKREKALKAQA